MCMVLFSEVDLRNAIRDKKFIGEVCSSDMYDSLQAIYPKANVHFKDVNMLDAYIAALTMKVGHDILSLSGSSNIEPSAPISMCFTDTQLSKVSISSSHDRPALFNMQREFEAIVKRSKNGM